MKKIFLSIILILSLLIFFLHFLLKKKEIIFLHIPKNAGTTFKSMYPEIKNRNHANSFPNDDEINIAIIRNPITRFQSIFNHIKNRSQIKKNSDDLLDINSLDELAKAYYDDNNINHNKIRNMLSWNKNKINSYKNLKKNNGGCPINKKKIGCIHWAPQYLFIDNSDKIDYLLKFENLENDLKRLHRLGILKKKKILFKNKSKESPKKITPIVKKLIMEIYKEDFDLWNRKD